MKNSLHPYWEYIYPILNTSTFRVTAQKTLFPEQNKSVCAAILLYNLADPEWITIGYYEPLVETHASHREVCIKLMCVVDSTIFINRL